VPLLILLLAVPVLLIALTPVLLLQRYRIGTARRLARPWVTQFTLGAMILSAAFFLVSAALTTLWVPRAFTAALAGLGVGLVLGIAGVWLARWEATPAALHYTPNRWLVLFITLVVVARVAYGLWRSWSVARAGFGGASAIAAFGVPESLAAAATVIGYYLAFSAGVRARIRRWEKRPLRVW
jgi:hypothetical protein